MTIFDRLTALGKLQRNWDSYGAEPVDLRCIEKAREVLVALSHVDFRWQPVPMQNGGVALELHADGFDIEVSVERFTSAASQSEPSEPLRCVECGKPIAEHDYFCRCQP